MKAKALKHQPGEQIGPFTLERALGRGAAAEVWLATETSELGFSKRQALKLLQPPPGELEEQKEALLNEARVCGLLKHPGVVDVYKVDSIAGELFIAMEFIDGPDLNTLLHALRVRGISLPVGAALDIAIELSEALDYVHNAQGPDGEDLHIIHRDLKPSNVLVDRIGVLKITDWGLVKSHINIGATTRGVVKGTPGYISPEVWGGTREFKPAGDLFAVGAILFEAVQGERLFQGRNLGKIAQQVAHRSPREEAEKVQQRCPDLVPILEKLLQRNPEHRHQRAAELIPELREVRDLYPARESFKAFIQDHSKLLEEIAPRRIRSAILARTETAADAIEADTEHGRAEQSTGHGRAEENAEDSLWDGSTEDAEESLQGNNQPIGNPVATRAMPGVRKATLQPGSDLPSLPASDGVDFFEGMKRTSEEYTDPSGEPATEMAGTAINLAGSQAAADPTPPAPQAAADPTPPAAAQPPEFDDDDENTVIDEAAPTERNPAQAVMPKDASEEAAEEDHEETAPGLNAAAATAQEPTEQRPKRRQRRARRKRPHPWARRAELVALGVALGGISLFLTGVAFILLW